MMDSEQHRKKFFWIIPLIGLLLGATQFFFASSDDLIINEFVAANGTGLTDENGDYSDWIEIYNQGGRTVNLSGWSLTDDVNQPEKWTFPEMTLKSGEYLLLFASGKSRRSVDHGARLHTNFMLDKQGEFLGLYNVLNDRFADQVWPTFPEQFRDIAYGHYGNQLAYGYLMTPTPGEPNNETLIKEGLVSTVTFSMKRGFYDTAFTLELTSTTPGATIHYTMDGSEPTESVGIIYTTPITINTTSSVRAIAFKSNFLPSRMDTHSYIFLDDILEQPPSPSGFPTTWGTYPEDFKEYVRGTSVRADYEMDPNVVNVSHDLVKDGLRSIPSINIVMNRQSFANLYSNPRERGLMWEYPASVELIYPDDTRTGFQINAGIRIQGNLSRREAVHKHSLRLFFRNKYGAARLEYPLFPDSQVENFDTIVLRASTDESFVATNQAKQRATYTRDSWLRTSQIAVSGIGSHGIFVHLYLNGLYWGLYNVVERPDTAFMSSYMGGEEEDWYAVNHSGLISGQYDRFRTLHDFASAGGLEDPEKYATIKQYIDTAHFIDYLILNIYSGNVDWADNNWYATIRNPYGRARYFIWDAEASWITGAFIQPATNRLGLDLEIKVLVDALMESSNFRMEFADRMYKHLFNDGALTEANTQARWLRLNNSIEQALVAESARWGDVRYEPSLTQQDVFKAANDVLTQMDGNVAKLIALARQADYYPSLDPPTFNQQGLAESGFNIIMSLSDGDRNRNRDENGIIYYTLDGSDPRSQITGAVSQNALVYQSPLMLTSTIHVKTRVLAGDNWSALNEATFRVMVEDKQLRITEIMYNPAGSDDYEFIELKNVGNVALNLSGMSFEGIQFTFPANSSLLLPGKLMVLVRNRQAFAQRYPDVSVGGQYEGHLSNEGEAIILKDVQGQIIASVTYDDRNGWPITPDGRGDSLNFVNLTGDPDDPKNWHAAVNLNGSPGEEWRSEE